MPYIDIDFVSERAVEELVGCDDTIVISIRSSKGAPAEIMPGFKDVLYLAFDSNLSEQPGNVKFSAQHAEEILTFVERYNGTARKIIVNCGAGECRSAAVALYLSQKYNVPLHRNTDYALLFLCYMLGTQDRVRIQVPVVPAQQPARAA